MESNFECFCITKALNVKYNQIPRLQTTPGIEDKPNTWCKKVPRKICAPDNCRMVSGPQECSQKNIVSTVQKPTELCDLQPQQHCRLITKLTPHLISKEVCRKVPKEVCHLALSPPKTVRKPITLKWCTRKKHEHSSGYKAPNSYLPPPHGPHGPQGPPLSPQYAPAVPPPPSPLRRVPSPPPALPPIGPTFQPAPQFSAPSRRPIQDCTMIISLFSVIDYTRGKSFKMVEVNLIKKITNNY